ncbi:helix-turn-helix domain-containing protein [Azospirillum canadense]|uniref:helix-turn-helix domain-containing protein n=1 Tax=Azospirillum canadense TaxID=403962 RepID=UPI002227E800|nr:helix-turn-helix domain-containing protein [Azospirillum canadense]MCW2242266.1 transcriptional regulator with XRE-family HTH domain [Azospirillum canadense]
MITAAQIRAARALLNMKQASLAAAAGVSLATLNNIERGVSAPRVSTLVALQRALEDAGVRFIDGDGEGPGVRLSKAAASKFGQFFTPREVISHILHFSGHGHDQQNLVVDPAAGSGGMLFHAQKFFEEQQGAEPKWDVILGNPPFVLIDACAMGNRVEAGRLGEIDLARPDLDTTSATSQLLQELLHQENLQAARLFITPVNRDRTAPHARKGNYNHSLGALTKGAAGLVLVDRAPLVYRPDHRPRMGEVKAVVEAALASGRPVEVATRPLSVDTATLPAGEAIKAIASVDYEPLQDLSQIERLASHLAP